MVAFCILGSIALGIVVGVALFCATRRGSISIDIDIRQEPLTPEQKQKYVEKWAKKGIVPSAAYQLRQQAIEGLLPTPISTDYQTACKHGDGSPSLKETIAEIGGETFRLSPLFTEEMMGFPFLWTTLPFLSQSGEPNPSKPMETPSSRRSCTESFRQ